MANPITDMQWPRFAGVTQGLVLVHVVHALCFTPAAKSVVQRLDDSAEDGG